ncbi:hypothetical protein BC629DRAFT_383338 [Irpex lacteus]|nr:hypothetical protein BC629DRAFT_383338 [Irpex lacteus]
MTRRTMFLGIASSITWPLGISSLACLLRAIQVIEGSPTYLNHETSFCHMSELDYGTCAIWLMCVIVVYSLVYAFVAASAARPSLPPCRPSTSHAEWRGTHGYEFESVRDAVCDFAVKCGDITLILCTH